YFVYRLIVKIIRDTRLKALLRSNPNALVLTLYKNLRFILCRIKLLKPFKWMTPKEVAEYFNLYGYKMLDQKAFVELTEFFIKACYSRQTLTACEVNKSIALYNLLKQNLLKNCTFFNKLLLRQKMFSILKRNWFVKFRRFPVPYKGM
ncbi:MAG: hypothetical protein DRP78_01295, partial [Candidatus Omnitrophota bacterium]